MHIIYFQTNLNSLNSIEYELYNKIIKDFNQYPIIYTDNVSIPIDKNIPVFHTYYLRNCIHKKIVVTNIDSLDYFYSNKSLRSSCYIIVLYDRQQTRIQKDKVKDVYFCDINLNNVTNIIKSINND